MTTTTDQPRYLVKTRHGWQLEPPPASEQIATLRQAVQLVLALHEHPEAAPPGSNVHLDPMAEQQLRAALELSRV